METTTLLSIIAITVSACSFVAHFIKCNREEAKKGKPIKEEPKTENILMVRDDLHERIGHLHDYMDKQLSELNSSIGLIEERLSLHNIALNSHTTKLNQLTKAKQPTKTTAKKK